MLVGYGRIGMLFKTRHIFYTIRCVLFKMEIELILKKYFKDEIDSNELNSALDNFGNKSEPWTPMITEDEFEIDNEHLIKLADGFLEEKISANRLESIAFLLIGSNFFTWDTNNEIGRRVSDTLFQWDNPEINFPITITNMIKWKKYLESGQNDLNTIK